jgi:multisubunit Na+/H+ antiporter MnhB subunit
MSLIEVLDIALAGLVLAAAVWTIVSREAFAAVVGYVVYGLLVALVWVRLFALDVALTEAAIGSGATGVLLITAAMRLRRTDPLPDDEPAVATPSALTRLAAMTLCLAVAAGLAVVALALPDPGPTLAPEAARHLAETGLGNPITGVLMAYRAFDTMLEKVVLVLAVIGVWSLAPDRAWGGVAGPRALARPDGPLAFLAQLLPPIGIVVGIHIVWVGANEPGGAFQGGALLAAMALIVMMARLVEAPAVSRRWLRLALVSGPAVFLVMGVLGFATASGFLAYPSGFAKPLILFIEAFMTLSIAATLPLLVIGPPDRPLSDRPPIDRPAS